ncbi:MAG TPA: hypothetical protein ACFYD4_12680 [Candidatus Wunengus sp. YC61]|uniref:hypothetical protein n=1 Tax=Candidatus Wunengus sp. YC61 TaxID=3367698 RepID=UPI0040279819
MIKNEGTKRIKELEAENKRLRDNLERVCYVAVGEGVMSRTLCAKMLEIDLCDLDGWILEYEGVGG